jgi:hypothetical protein
MATRNILDYQGNVIGTMTLPDSTTDSQWALILAPYAITPTQVQANAISMSISVRKAYCDDLMDRFKKQNILAGINGSQGLWMHHRLRAMAVTAFGVDYVIDIVNMIVSGDVELGCIALQYSVPDDMSQSYHWLSATRINWLIADLKNFLGWP